ncbi:MAG TPA: HAMP domain-containing sensor histidine kinase [Candidatus Saccharimonadales bacterium]|nr:HAMP domain-containing sensor histidine kinase [Candidatus Saccharimonadales bacterium]
MRLSIRIKVLMTVSFSLILIFTVITYILLNQNTNRLRSSLNEQSKSYASLATKPIGDTFALYKDSGKIRITQQVNNFLALDPDVNAIRIVSVDGTVLYSSDKNKPASLPEDLASSFDAKYLKNDKKYIVEVVQPFFEDSGAHRYSIVYSISTKRVEENVGEVIKLIIYIAIGTLILTIAGTGILLEWLFIKPLNRVSESANIISSGDFDHKITSKNNDEIGDLAASVERMADFLKADIAKLRELDKMKSEFMMIASHNLRTPITIIQGYIDLAKSVDSSGELKNIINTIEESVVRLHLLAENVLTISTMETGKSIMRKSPEKMKGFIEAIDKEFGLLATKKDLDWQFNNSVPDDISMVISATNIRSALGNLVDNAIKFTKAGGSIKIDAFVEDGQLIFKVQDTGIGINTGEMPQLFTKFHRGTSTLNYDYEGIGIGLYLSRLIMRQHGGDIKAESKMGEGSTFTASLPLKG